MERIKSFEEACKVLNLDPEKVIPDVSAFPAQHQAALVANGKLFIVAEALNEGWKPDWNNDEEWKYYPWFDMEKDEKNNPSGFRLLDVFYDCADSDVGSRLCFKSRELAEYAGEQFIDLYRDLMVI